MSPSRHAPFNPHPEEVLNPASQTLEQSLYAPSFFRFFVADTTRLGSSSTQIGAEGSALVRPDFPRKLTENASCSQAQCVVLGQHSIEVFCFCFEGRISQPWRDAVHHAKHRHIVSEIPFPWSVDEMEHSEILQLIGMHVAEK